MKTFEVDKITAAITAAKTAADNLSTSVTAKTAILEAGRTASFLQYEEELLHAIGAVQKLFENLKAKTDLIT